MSFGNASAAQDNTKIWAIGVQPDVEVVKYEPQKKKFVPLITGLSATDVDYSKDGKWIAYVSDPGRFPMARPRGWIRTIAVDLWCRSGPPCRDGRRTESRLHSSA